MSETENPSKMRLNLHQKHHKEIMRWMRQAFKWSGLITECKAKHRLKRGVYECGYCGDELGAKDFQIDHENPCVALDENHITGYNYTGIVKRMFDSNNLVLTCKPCHRVKTGQENSFRKKGVPLPAAQTQSIKDGWTEEKKLKFSMARGKSITCIETGQEFRSAGVAAEETGINLGNITSCANRRLITAGGFHWKWTEEENYIIKKDMQKRKIQCLETGNIYSSMADAAREMGFKSSSGIGNVLAGRSKTHKGFTFEYIEEKE